MTIDEIIEIARDACEARGVTASGDPLWGFVETELREGCEGYAEAELLARAEQLMVEAVEDLAAVRQAFERLLT